MGTGFFQDLIAFANKYKEVAAVAFGFVAFVLSIWNALQKRGETKSALRKQLTDIVEKLHDVNVEGAKWRDKKLNEQYPRDYDRLLSDQKRFLVRQAKYIAEQIPTLVSPYEAMVIAIGLEEIDDALEAKNWFRKALSKSPGKFDEVIIRRQFGRALFRSGHADEARAQFLTASEILEGDSDREFVYNGDTFERWLKLEAEFGNKEKVQELAGYAEREYRKISADWLRQRQLDRLAGLRSYTEAATSADFQIIELRLAPDIVQRLPNRQRNQLVGCMHAHNELVVLNRLLMFSLNDVGDGALHDHAHGVQMWTIMQLLTGKLFETWEMLDKRFLNSNPEDPAITGLSPEHKTSLTWLRNYFGDKPRNETALRTIRDKTAFHYDKLNLDEAVAAQTPEESVMYIAEHPANACYYLGSVLVFRAIFAAIADQATDTSGLDEGTRVAEGSKITLKDINEVNLHVHNVLYGLISWLLEKETGKTFEEMEELRIPVVGAPKPSRIALPMFINIGPD